MRTLTSTLEAYQQKKTLSPLIKIVLTSGETEYTYTKTRILDINHTEEIYSQKATVLLNNSDKTLNDIDFKGYQGVISYGCVTSEGEEYSACAPLWVMTQEFTSSPSKLVCELKLVGIPDMMAEDEANASYEPDTTNTDTVKDLIDAIAGATLDCFDHCTAYTVTWDSEDDLIDAYQPKDSFRVYTGDSRLAKIRWLLELTNCVARFEDDGEIHIFEPTTSGDTYDYEYSLASGHTFFAKAYKKRLTIPNYVVVRSLEDDDPSYSGYAKDDDSYDLLPIRSYKRLSLASNDQAGDIAEALLAKYQMGSDAGSASVPLNVGAELYDYVDVTDARQSDERAGNIGYIKRHYKPGTWEMTFSFGNWFGMINARKTLNELKAYTDAGNYFSRLEVKDLFAQNIQADNLDLVWLDPDSNIDLSKIGDTLDSLPDGETYARVKSVHLDAGQIKLDETVYYSTGYDPTDKFDLDDNDLDDIPEGTTYQRVLSTQITAGKIVLSSTGFIVSEDYVKADSQGIVLAGTGITLDDCYLRFYTDTTYAYRMGFYSGAFHIEDVEGTYLLHIKTASDLEFEVEGDDIYPYADVTTDLGTATYAFNGVYCANLFDGYSSPTKVKSALDKVKALTMHISKRTEKGEEDIEEEAWGDLPPECVREPTRADYDKAEEVYQRRLQNYNDHPKRLAKLEKDLADLKAKGKAEIKKRGFEDIEKKLEVAVKLEREHPPKMPVKDEPKKYLSIQGQMGFVLSALREITERIESLEAR